MKFSIRLICAVTYLGFAAPLAATPVPHAGVFVFSTLCTGAEDAGGAEIVLLRGPAGDTAVFTRTEGPIMAPLLAYGPNVKIDDRTGHVALKFVDLELGNGGTYLFEGSVSNEAIELSGNIGGPIRLPRITTFQSSLPKCKS